MRRTLWSGLIKTLKHNQNRQQTRVKIFETGLVFSSEPEKLLQSPKLGGLVWGSVYPEQWGSESRLLDFYDAKGDVEQLLSASFSLDEFQFKAESHPALQVGQTARITRIDEAVGWVGALHPVLQKALDIPGKVYLFELDLAVLRRARLPIALPLSRFPMVRRDLALLADKSLETADVVACLRKSCGDELIKAVVFDVYAGDNIADNKKSLGLGLTFQHPSRTLTDDEINSIIGSAIKVLQDKFNIELRI
jgi:phenylalanyl-tRNA synthetase beta chain